MASRYWNPSADANWADANVWATTDGGDPTGIATPTSADNVFFSNTNSHKCTIGATANCLNLDFTYGTGFVGTLAGASALNISGNLTMNASIIGTYLGTITMNATSGTKTITTASNELQSLTINGSGGTFQFLDNLNLHTTFTINAGTVDFTTYTTTFLFNGATMGFTVGAYSPTFYNLTIAPTTPAKGNAITLDGGITVTNNLTISDGATLTNRVLVSSSVVGTPRTITCTGASVNYSNTDFQDITIVSGTLGTNSSVGDCGGNTGITFTVAVDQHWTNASSGSWSVSTNWTSRVPLPQDNVFMDKAFGTSQTVTADMPRLGKSIDWTGATWTTGLTFTLSGTSTIYGSFTSISGLTHTVVGIFIFSGRSSYFLTNNSVVFGNSIQVIAYGGTLALVDNLTMGSGRSITTTNGIFSAVNGATNSVISTPTLVINSGSTFTAGSATHLITGTGSVLTTTGTITASTGTIKFNNTSNSAITFAGGGKTYNNIYFSRGASTGSITISGSNTFNDFKDDGTAAHSLLFTKSTTNHIATWNVNGAGGGVRTILDTADGAGTFTLNGTGTILSCDWLDIRRSAVDTSPVWYAGANSLDTASNTYWIFTVPYIPVEATSAVRNYISNSNSI